MAYKQFKLIIVFGMHILSNYTNVQNEEQNPGIYREVFV